MCYRSNDNAYAENLVWILVMHSNVWLRILYLEIESIDTKNDFLQETLTEMFENEKF